MNRPDCLKSLILTAFAASALLGQDTKYPPQGPQFPGSPSKTDSVEWLHELKQYRPERRVRSGLERANYERPELKWTLNAVSLCSVGQLQQFRFLFGPFRCDKCDVRPQLSGTETN